MPSVQEDEESEGIWVCEKEDSLESCEEALFADGLTFRNGHAVDAEYAGMLDSVDIEDDIDKEDLEEEGFEVNVDEEALNGMYQWVDDILVELRSDSAAVVNMTKVLSNESVETEVDESTAAVVPEDTVAAIERDKGVPVARVELYDSRPTCHLSPYRADVSCCDEQVCCCTVSCAEPQVKGCTIKGAKSSPEMPKSLGELPGVPSQATVITNACDVTPSGAESKAEPANVIVCMVQTVSPSPETVCKLPCQVVDASYIALPVSCAEEHTKSACYARVADVPLHLVYVTPLLSLSFHEPERVFSIGLLPLDRARVALSSGSSPGDKEPKNQFKVPKSEHAHRTIPCRDPLHLRRYHHCCRSSLPGGRSRNVSTRARSRVVGCCLAMPVSPVV